MHVSGEEKQARPDAPPAPEPNPEALGPPELSSEALGLPELSLPNRTVWDDMKQIWDTVRITLFVLGSALVVFVAARNTITWHVQKLWGASGSYWQSRWDIIYYDVFGGDVMLMGFWGTFIISNTVFFSFNSLLMFLDLTGKPEFLLRYKIQDAKEVPLNRTSFMRCLRLVLFNTMVVGAPVTYGFHKIMQYRGCDFGPVLPSFHWVVIELAVFILMEEFGFYYSHRLMHHPRLYKHIHKKHHEWTASIGIVGVYAHPLEHVISNLLPPVLGPILMGSHVTTAWLWFSMALISTSISHSGYHFPFLPSPEAHDFHHLKFTNNFGVLGILDRLHGTDTIFRASKQYQRHYMSLTMAPLRQVHPDEAKVKNGKIQGKAGVSKLE